ncbi:L-rhamnose mutarotase [Polaribacter sp. Q13]|uniref:L-rhamnose mutarotase n=1 Tax=Polaribacter sp. Q13 TaxID=2806551 RepID=UPI00193B0856|nr:L-rhamnose mutarotase [Polaribacter sp. Q13]QVY66265.1 L-rhamnose mutarotase [Polaribacter sp. Q13]
MSVNLFKRFTYFFTSDSTILSDEFKPEIFKQLKSSEGIKELNVYQKDNNYFMVADVDVSFNSEKIVDTLTLLINSEDFNSILPIHNEALERIYKLDQKAIYSAVEGQLKDDIGEKKRFVWTLLLEPDLIEEYKSVHGINMAWPEITANMKTVGVKDMEIYIHGEQVMLIMDSIPDFDLDEVGPKWQKLPREEEWQAYVAKFQKTDTESAIQEKWQDMKNISSN